MTLTRGVAVLALVAAGALTACGSEPAIFRASADVHPSPRDTPTTHPTGPPRRSPPHCGRINIATDAYGTTISPTSGPPGTKVTLEDTTLRDEGGRWTLGSRLEAWWNTDTPGSEIPGGHPYKDSPVLELAEVDDLSRCRFETTFTVPDVEPGSYRISVFIWFVGGYGVFLPHHFTVTPVPPQCPRVDEGGYTIELSADSGPPGKPITISGVTPVYGEDGYVGPDGEIQFWWNADPDHWHEVLPGPPDALPKNRSADVVSLGAVQLSDCTFEFEFEIPDVAPGDYPILPLAFSFKDSGAWDGATFHAAYAPVFRVTEHR